MKIFNNTAEIMDYLLRDGVEGEEVMLDNFGRMTKFVKKDGVVQLADEEELR